MVVLWIDNDKLPSKYEKTHQSFFSRKAVHSYLHIHGYMEKIQLDSGNSKLNEYEMAILPSNLENHTKYLKAKFESDV